LGYVDGGNLYFAYFAPQSTDPTGTEVYGECPISGIVYCDPSDGSYGTTHVDKNPVYNCTKHTTTKTYFHSTTETITLSASGAYSSVGVGVEAATTHTEGESESIEFDGCGAAHYRYTFECECKELNPIYYGVLIEGGISSLGFFITELLTGEVVCDLTSEGWQEDDPSEFCE
jgi:hypothetical protein